LYSFRSIPLLFPFEPGRSVPSPVVTRGSSKATKNQYGAFALNRYCEYGGVETAVDRIIWIKSTLLIKPKSVYLHLLNLLRSACTDFRGVSCQCICDESQVAVAFVVGVAWKN
jgi:hypothetical protein